MTGRPPGRRYSAWLGAASALAALCIALYDYFLPHGPISRTAGVMLVIVATAIMLIAALAVAALALPGRLATLLEAGIVIDVVGSGIAAWFLESGALMAVMALALVFFILHVVLRSAAMRRGDPARA